MVSEDSASTDDIDKNLHIATATVPASGATSRVQTGFLNKHGGFFSHGGFPNRIICQSGSKLPVFAAEIYSLLMIFRPLISLGTIGC